MSLESVFDPDHRITSLQELYSSWATNAEDNVIRKGYRRICDLKWISLAWHECKCSSNYEHVDREYCEVTMDQLGWKDKLVERWVHLAIPILRMSLRQVVDSLLGIEWHVFCEPYDLDPARGKREWIAHVRHTVNLLRYRAYFLATHELCTSVLDAEEYVLTEEEMKALVKKDGGEAAVGDGEGGKRSLKPEDYSYVDGDDSSATKKEELTRLAEERKQRLLLQRELESLAKMYMSNGIASRSTRVNLAMVFDVNTILHSIDTGLDVYEQKYAHLQPQPLDRTVESILMDVRKQLMERFQTMSTVFRVRRKWHCEMVCIPSFRTLYRRKKGLTATNKATDEDIVLGKLGKALNKHLPGTHDEFILQPVGLNRTKWLQVNTDALVYIYCMQQESGGYRNMWSYLSCTQEEYEANPNVHLSGNADQRQKPRIFRIRITGQYGLSDVDGTLTIHPSFGHALLELRKRMVARGDASVVYEFFRGARAGEPLGTRAFQKYNLAQCDSLFGIVELQH